MASPSKQPRKDDDSIVGYLHCVSPVKTSRRNLRYFEATLQTGREEYHRVVAFSVDKRIPFTQASQNNSPVKLANVRRGLSYSDPSGFDVLCSNSTTVEVVEDVAFFPREPRSMGQMTIEEVLRLGPRQRVGVVDAKILPEGTVSRVVPVDGVQCELKELQICDPTGQTTLTLWEKLILTVEVGKSYKLANLSTRKAGDRTVLTTTQTTTVSEISAVGEPESVEVHGDDRQDTSIVRGTVTGVQISAKHRCRRCHTSQEPFVSRSLTHRCQRCKLLQKASSFVASYSGVLLLMTSDGQEQSPMFTNSALSAYLKEKDIGDSMGDLQVIEEHFLSVGDVELSVNAEGLIVSVKDIVSEKGSPECEATGFAEGMDELFLKDDKLNA
ncbi:uncharacterized protein LOC124487777 [Hypomesus transpacificus]|uniref:uncharacterized protein LOC124487777 n=1 Tax=Hypomesus transpacificus TaxID=137520 RepID=UPI001F0854BB|nr:uncharacterized protein LOC124487777 [Hypomesus transpacificus]